MFGLHKLLNVRAKQQPNHKSKNKQFEKKLQQMKFMQKKLPNQLICNL